MQQKIIIDLCGGTGNWSKPYKIAGYTTHVITLPEYDVMKTTFHEEGMLFYGAGDPLTVLYEGVYGILAAPPCTEFSLAKGSQPRNFEAAMDIVKACLEVIWHCRINGNLKFWALENPVGFLRQFMGRPAFTFEQWQFGGDKIKPTDLWGYFRPPFPTVKERSEKVATNLGKRSHGVDWAKLETPAEYQWLSSLPYNARRAAIRAITPTGFAQAFFRANNAVAEEDQQEEDAQLSLF